MFVIKDLSQIIWLKWQSINQARITFEAAVDRHGDLYRTAQRARKVLDLKWTLQPAGRRVISRVGQSYAQLTVWLGV